VSIAAGVLMALAVDPPSGGIDVTPIINVGAFGTLSLLLLWFSLGVYKREARRADRAEAALQALQAKVIDLYVPAVTEATRVVGDFLDEARRRDRG
jgi:hypothetical protein